MAEIDAAALLVLVEWAAKWLDDHRVVMRRDDIRQVEQALHKARAALSKQRKK